VGKNIILFLPLIMHFQDYEYPFLNFIFTFPILWTIMVGLLIV
jgi:hypothetical protein